MVVLHTPAVVLHVLCWTLRYRLDLRVYYTHLPLYCTFSHVNCTAYPCVQYKQNTTGPPRGTDRTGCMLLVPVL